MTRTEQLIAMISENLDAKNIHYDFKDDAHRIITFTLRMKNKLDACQFILFTEDRGITVYGCSPVHAKSDCYANVTEYITRANYGLRHGNFEFDHRDGEIRYKVYIPCKNNLPNSADIDNAILVVGLMMERYGDGLLRNMMGIGHPEEDIRAIEGN